MNENGTMYEEYKKTADCYAPEKLEDVIRIDVESRRRLFRDVCKQGYLDIAKELYNIKHVKIYLKSDDFTEIIVGSCIRKEYESARWAYHVGKRKLRNWLSPFNISCMCNNLETAKLLYDKNPEQEVDWTVFDIVCCYGEVEMLKFLCEIAGEKYCNAEEISSLTKFTCHNNNLENVKFLFSTEHVKHIDVEECFMDAIKCCNMEMVRYLYSFGRIDIQNKSEEIYNHNYTHDKHKKIVFDWLNEVLNKK